MSQRNGAGAAVAAEAVPAGARRVVSLVIGERVRVLVPEPAAPFWRCQDGARHSLGSLRCGVDPDAADTLAEAHVEAIRRIARAALAASQRGDRGETARLAMAAARLCQEIAGHWPPSAVEVQRR